MESKTICVSKFLIFAQSAEMLKKPAIGQMSRGKSWTTVIRPKNAPFCPSKNEGVCVVVLLPVEATKSLFSLSQVIQSVPMTVMTSDVMRMDPSQKTPIRSP